MGDQECKVVVGSCIPGNVERISVALETDFDCMVVGCWDDFEKELLIGSRLTFLTDLNLCDYFPLVVFNKMLEIGDNMAVIILLENLDKYTLYREKAHSLWEVLPIESVNDTRFLSAVEASQFRFDMWKPHS